MAAIDFRDARVLRFIVGMVLLAGLIYVYFSFVASGLKEQIAEAEDTLLIKESTYNQLRSRTSEDMALLQQQMEMHSQELERLDRFLPRSYSQENVLEMLAQKTGNSGLQVISMSPMPPVVEGAYNVYTWQIHLTGRFHRMGVFLDQLTQEMMMTSISNVEIHQLKAAEGKFDNIEATFTFSAFVQP